MLSDEQSEEIDNEDDDSEEGHYMMCMTCGRLRTANQSHASFLRHVNSCGLAKAATDQKKY